MWLAPMWKSYADDGLTVEESDGVAKIYGIVPRFPERYVEAGFELSDAMPIETFGSSVILVANLKKHGGSRFFQMNQQSYAEPLRRA